VLGVLVGVSLLAPVLAGCLPAQVDEGGRSGSWWLTMPRRRWCPGWGCRSPTTVARWSTSTIGKRCVIRRSRCWQGCSCGCGSSIGHATERGLAAHWPPAGVWASGLWWWPASGQACAQRATRHPSCG